MKITYTKCGDYYIPNIEFPKPKTIRKIWQIKIKLFKRTRPLHLYNVTYERHIARPFN